jgi:hypothetical protein
MSLSHSCLSLQNNFRFHYYNIIQKSASFQRQKELNSLALSLTGEVIFKAFWRCTGDNRQLVCLEKRPSCEQPWVKLGLNMLLARPVVGLSVTAEGRDGVSSLVVRKEK